MKAVIDVRNANGHYEVYVKGSFYCSCDPSELSETIREIEKELQNVKTE